MTKGDIFWCISSIAFAIAIIASFHTFEFGGGISVVISIAMISLGWILSFWWDKE